MIKLPVFSASRIIKVLEKIGFEKIRQRGSHVFLKHADGRATVVPVHYGEDIGRGLIRKILKDIDVSPREFLKLFNK